MVKHMDADARVLSAWRHWLGALATDADAAHAAAMAYKDLDGAGRDVWLDALARDTGDIDVPKIAVYAPLLAVEIDPERRQRIEGELSSANVPAFSGDRTPRRVQALQGVTRGSKLHVAAVIMPLYLDFVQVFACGYTPGVRFEWVRHDPIVATGTAPGVGANLADAILEAQPLKAVIDDLAITVLAHRRAGLELPSALEVLTELFAPCLDDGIAESA
ncbi:MAG TPA: hypothetical protein VHO25_02900 [Polyangiaceae bacterium]|nr:hypothetical protein [Polyangiaceae bacterium]